VKWSNQREVLLQLASDTDKSRTKNRRLISLRLVESEMQYAGSAYPGKIDSSVRNLARQTFAKSTIRDVVARLRGFSSSSRHRCCVDKCDSERLGDSKSGVAYNIRQGLPKWIRFRDYHRLTPLTSSLRQRERVTKRRVSSRLLVVA
jgi:hypothetical protein